MQRDSSREIDDGYNLQHIYEAGPVFESLLNHPSWWGWVQHFLGEAEPFMHEMFLNVRGRGGYIGVHSGGPNLGRSWCVVGCCSRSRSCGHVHV
jgi:hypothetical protein